MLAYQYLQKASAYRNEPYYQRYRTSVQAIEETLARHVGQLRVLGSPVGAEVLLNGELVGNLPMAAPRALEVGSYVLEVRKAGYFPLRRPVDIPGGTRLSQEAVELKPAPPSPSVASVARRASSGAAGSEASAASATSPLRARWITWTLGGTSVALVTTSAIAFAVRENDAKRWNDDSRCLSGASPMLTREQVCGDLRGDAKTAERIGIVTGVLGIGLGGAALAHWLWTAEGGSSEKQSGERSPACGIGLGSIACQGTF
jgi:hypothetical protein